MYKMFVRPHLDYCDIIYHTPPLTNPFDSCIKLNSVMERIEQVQYLAALAVTGTWHGSSRNKLYEELGWESLSDRRWSRRLIQIYKIHNNMTPDYLRANLTCTRGISLRNRDPNHYREIFCNKSKYRNSFFPDSIKAWNNIGREFISSPTLSILKRKIFNLVLPNHKSIYGIRDPIGLKRLFQLRVH